RVAILGLGLIGGSLARDLSRLGMEVYGYDRTRGVTRSARASGVLTDELGPDLQGLENVEIVILALPVSVAPRVLQDALPRLGEAVLITDTGSTKRAICAQAELLGLGPRFVGSHPFAGDHRSGWEASHAGLFQEARVFLCPVEGTTPRVLERAQSLWQRLGARPEVMEANAHDQRLAWSSHLPQLSASVLALALVQAGTPRSELGRGGQDVTRLAGSDPELWTGVVMENAQHIGPALAAVEKLLAALRAQIESGNEVQVVAA
ncbi:MAG: prephenate dehydrogenase, partial [Longimicrobiales bacterium]